MYNFSDSNSNYIKFLDKHKFELQSLLKINKITYNPNPKKDSETAYIVVKNTTILIPLKEIVDIKIEINKLQLKRSKAQKNIDSINSKLTNSSFLSKAPTKVIEKFKKDANDIKSSIEKIYQIIDTIK